MVVPRFESNYFICVVELRLAVSARNLEIPLGASELASSFVSGGLRPMGILIVGVPVFGSVLTNATLTTPGIV